MARDSHSHGSFGSFLILTLWPGGGELTKVLLMAKAYLA